MNDEINDLLGSLKSAQQLARTTQDKAREFRLVFLGTEAGKRVFYDILDWARISDVLAAPGDPHETYRRIGMRDLGLLIIATVHGNVEPTTPTKQQIKEE